MRRGPHLTAFVLAIALTPTAVFAQSSDAATAELLYQQGLVRYEDDAADALVDRSAPGPLRMDLTPHWGGPNLALRPIWEQAE